MARPKGQPKLGGRKKGTPNKLTSEIQTMILEALDKKGGVKYLEKQADEKPAAFLALVGKVLPLTVASGATPVPMRIELVSARPETSRTNARTS